MVFIVLLAASAPSAAESAVDSNADLYFEIRGRVKQFNPNFVALIADADHKVIWLPRATVMGALQMGQSVTAIVSPADLAEHRQELIILNRSENK